MRPIQKTGLTGGIPGISKLGSDVAPKLELEKTGAKPADQYGAVTKGGNGLSGHLPADAVKANPTASASKLWGSPETTARSMVSAMQNLAKAAESGSGGLETLATQYTQELNGHDPAVRAGSQWLWSGPGASTRAELESAATRVAKAAPDLVFPGYVAPSETALFAQMDPAQLLIDALLRNDLPRTQWAPKATEAQLNAMSADQLRTFLADDIVASRTRRAETAPLEMAVAEAQVKGEPEGIRKAAQAIVDLGAKGKADLGAMFEFYEKLARG